MTKHAPIHAIAAAALCTLALPPVTAIAQDTPTEYPSPGEIVATAPASEWVRIAPEDLLMMELAPDREGRTRRVVIQLMPPPFSQGWVGNIRKLAAAHWWDGTSVNRVQDNYVVQWGDATEEKPLPDGLNFVSEKCYSLEYFDVDCGTSVDAALELLGAVVEDNSYEKSIQSRDPYSDFSIIFDGWPMGMEQSENNHEWSAWPVHCYGMVGVGRNLSPDTGTGAELYTVIGQAPRHLDRNIALVGRVIEGMENLSSLPRGTGDLGFYEDPAQRVPITSVRLASELPQAEQPSFEYLSTEGQTFAAYADARANRRDPFFNVPAGGADICNIPVPVRRAGEN